VLGHIHNGKLYYNIGNASFRTGDIGRAMTDAPSFTEPLHAGTEFVMIEKREGWYHIRLADDRTCWVPEKSVGLVR
jgi:hypothetical protein